eukprot:scaffold88457_cov29-Phaeocystis_antarctica.AAC.1
MPRPPRHNAPRRYRTDTCSPGGPQFWAVGAVCGPGGPGAAIPPVRLQACLGALAGRVLNTCGASTHGVCCEGAYSKLPQVTPARGSTRLSGDFAALVRLRKKWGIDSAL